jgi:hypothetical protein
MITDIVDTIVLVPNIRVERDGDPAVGEEARIRVLGVHDEVDGPARDFVRQVEMMLWNSSSTSNLSSRWRRNSDMVRNFAAAKTTAVAYEVKGGLVSNSKPCIIGKTTDSKTGKRLIEIGQSILAG